MKVGRFLTPSFIFGVAVETSAATCCGMQLTKYWAGQLDDYVIDLAWSPDGAQLAAASAGGPISVFASFNGAKQHEFAGHENGTNCIAWQPATRMTGVTEHKTAGPRTQTAPTDSSPVGGPIVSPTLATGGQDGSVKFWDVTAGQHTATAKVGSGWVEHLAWCSVPQMKSDQSQMTGSTLIGGDLSPDPPSRSPVLFAAAGRTLSAVGLDATIAHTFKAAPKTISAVAGQPAGGSVAVAYFGGVVLWDTDDFVAQKELPYGNGIQALVWSPDSKWLVSGNQDPSVHLWIPEEDVELHMSGYEGKVKFLSFDHTSRWLATSGGREACIWDCAGAGPEGREPTMLPHEAPVCAVQFQNAHGLLATAAKDGVVQLWSPERRQPLRATVKMPSAATKLAWSPDDQCLAIGTEKGAIYVLKCEA
jgi:WD40 repeat protein